MNELLYLSLLSVALGAVFKLNPELIEEIKGKPKVEKSKNSAAKICHNSQY